MYLIMRPKLNKRIIKTCLVKIYQFSHVVITPTVKNLVVNLHAFYSENPCSNPIEVWYNFFSENCLKRTKVNDKEAGF